MRLNIIIVATYANPIIAKQSWKRTTRDKSAAIVSALMETPTNARPLGTTETGTTTTVTGTMITTIGMITMTVMVSES